MAMAGRHSYETEYGGKDGPIQLAEDGHVDLTAQEQSTLLRSEGIRGAGMDVTIPETDLHRAAVDEYLKDRETRFNGYTEEDVL
jgi:hypothetical protein